MLPNNRKPYKKTSSSRSSQVEEVQSVSQSHANRKKKKIPWYKKLIRMMVPTKKDRTVDKIRKVIFDVAIVVFIGSCIYLVNYYGQSAHNANFYDGVADMLGSGEVDENYPRAYLTKFASLWEMNDDIIGWLTIDGTKINYPVVQSEDNDYYLHKDFSKEDNRYGIPFADCRVDISLPSTNIPIYSHNMNDGQMFGELMNYESLDYYKQHPIIQFDSLYEEGKYKIVGMFIASTLPEHAPNFEYHNFIQAESDQELMDFAQEVLSRSLIVTGVDIQPGDHLVTLSTCTYDFKEARFAIVARRIREGESETVDTSAAYVNPNPVMPNAWYEAKKIAAQVSGVTVSPEEVALKTGESIDLTATVQPGTAVNRNVTWSSSDPDVATVDQNGAVTALRSGSTVITVTTEEGGFTASCSVQVGAGSITYLEFSSPSVAIPVDGTADLRGLLVVEPEGASIDDLIWYSSDDSVVTVDNGTATGRKAGKAVIAVETEDGVSAELQVQVGTYVPVTDLYISGPSVVAPKKTIQLQAVIDPEDATTTAVTWTSENTKIATVDDTGLVKGVKEGKTRIRADLYDSVSGPFTAFYSITVAKGGTIEIAIGQVEISVGHKASIEFSTSNGEEVVWTVTGGNGQVNLWEDDGYLVIEGVKAGEVTITGSFADGSSPVTITVTVTGSAPPDTEAPPESSEPEEPEPSGSEPEAEPSEPDVSQSEPPADDESSEDESESSIPSIWN